MRKHFSLFFYLLISFGSSCSFADDRSDFFRAIALDNARGVTHALQQGFDPNTPDEKGQLALYVALREGSARVVEALLAQPGIRVDVANAAGETPLMMAALRGETAWVHRLLGLGAAVHREGWSPLHYAATGPEAKTVAMLLDRGAPIDAPSPNRSTPLMMAARYGSEDSVNLLLARGASLRVRNDKDMGAADFARSAGRDALADRLERAAR